MCGIAGTLTLGDAPPPETLRRMAAAIAHRGPDGEGIKTFRGAGDLACSLVHRRLAILDLSEVGLQPMAGRGEKAWIVYNGEIYNYVELRTELATLGHVFRTGTDTEVLLAAWEEWREAMLPRLNGMFAFALWDSRDDALFLARDRFGEKPLFHRLHDGCFAFASEMKALAPLEGTFLPRAEADEAWIYRFLRFDQGEGDDAIVRGVRRLPPGSHMRVRRENGRLVATVTRWYHLPDVEPHDDRPDAAERLRALFDDAIRIRLRSDVPVGTSLSGGLDSSSVVATMAAVAPADAPRRAFTCRMEDPRLDEGKWARMVADAARAPLFEVRPTAPEFERDFGRFAAAQEEPVPVASPYAGFRVAALARENDTVVLLDGQGADEILAGYPWYPGIAVADHLAHARFLSAARTLRSAPSNARRRAAGSALAQTFRACAPRALKSLLFRFRPRAGAASAPLLSEDARRKHGVPANVFEPVRGRSWLDSALRYSLTAGPLQKLLRYEDRNSMLHGREVRLPFLDHRLVELALSLAEEWKISDGYTKRALREAMAGRLPDEVRLRRDKLAREMPDVLWLTGPLAGWFRERAEDARKRFAGLCDDARMREAIAAIDGAHPRRHAAVMSLFPFVSAAESVRLLESRASELGGELVRHSRV